MLVFAAADGEYSFSNNKNYDRIWNSKKDIHCIKHMPHPAHYPNSKRLSLLLLYKHNLSERILESQDELIIMRKLEEEEIESESDKKAAL